MTLRDVLLELSNYEFSPEKAIIMISKLCAVPCKAYRVIKEEIANKTGFETAETYALLNKLYESAILTKLASDTDCIEVFDTLRELYQTHVDMLRKHLLNIDFRDEKLNSLVDEILNNYKFNFRNVSEIPNPVCDLHFKLRVKILDSLETSALLQLFDYLCYIQVIVLAYKRVLPLEIDNDSNVDENAIEAVIVDLREDYYETAERIKDTAIILAKDVSEL